MKTTNRQITSNNNNKNYQFNSSTQLPKENKQLILPSLQQMEMTTLPREVLKWIQSLDLTYSVKNIKKDFNNGFLIAQILSRYNHNPAIVQMHSIDNGYSMERRRDNWLMINKYLKEINERSIQNFGREFLRIDDIELLIENKNNEILTFLIKLYQELTNRKIPQIEGKNTKTDTTNTNTLKSITKTLQNITKNTKNSYNT